MATKPATLIDVLGMGGWALDPASGQLKITRRIHDLGVTVVPPFDPKYAVDVPPAVHKVPRTEVLLYCGDSCGANLFAWVLAEVPDRIFDYAALIQASLYCNKNCPPIGANVKEVDVYYAPFITWPLPGLGNYKPQPVNTLDKNGVAQTLRYPGSYWVNNGKTKINYISVQTHVHPGDDNVGVQACIVGKVQELIGVPVTAKRKLN